MVCSNEHRRFGLEELVAVLNTKPENSRYVLTSMLGACPRGLGFRVCGCGLNVLGHCPDGTVGLQLTSSCIVSSWMCWTYQSCTPAQVNLRQQDPKTNRQEQVLLTEALKQGRITTAHSRSALLHSIVSCRVPFTSLPKQP